MWFLVLLLIAGCTEAHAVAPKKLEERPALPLNERLAVEAATRPARAIQPQQLIDALALQGVVITRHRQVLASPIDASYCETMSSEQGLALSLCEFHDDAAAQRGMAKSKSAFDSLLPGRVLDTRANSLLTVTSDEQRELARKTFAQLQPSVR